MAFDSDTAPQAFAALGHAGRLSVFRLLMRFAPRPVRPTEIAEALHLKANTLSGYLSDLMDAGLVSSTRDGRSLYYKVDMKSCEGLVGYLVNDCCRGRPDVCLPFESTEPERARPYRVLFLCSGNSARSIMAEALLRDLGDGRFTAYSAGTTPSGAINPQTLDLLARNGHETVGMHSKDISEFQGEGAPDFDFVFTVCDTAASEDCAPWVGQPLSAHWGLPDPVKAEGTEAERALAFAKTYEALRRRIEAFTALPIERLDRLSLQSEIDTLSTL
ncbi:ArsR family transcriptional regulator [Celeribacter neptunius]|uniref:Transcriptional regulator, ArsR family n=1 Tax=Celeribacter neptunius TaxID=588602 RepID=A0A1I3WFV2_9RHOB|nr:ArsR family transcriptional regulator [Celeribacter neptunius]SFK05687.1 transcriptional regulator, ArsR family [Celeribacter neptunius]